MAHPDIVDNWDIFDKYKMNWAIENMDSRKERFKTVEELAEFFGKKPGWKFVLDLNHCFSNDKSMKLASDFVDSLGDRIVEIHLSGYSGLHDPLFLTKQNFIIDYCKKSEAPIIIESVFDDVSQVQKEYDYIRNYLK